MACCCLTNCARAQWLAPAHTASRLFGAPGPRGWRWWSGSGCLSSQSCSHSRTGWDSRSLPGGTHLAASRCRLLVGGLLPLHRGLSMGGGGVSTHLAVTPSRALEPLLWCRGLRRHGAPVPSPPGARRSRQARPGREEAGGAPARAPQRAGRAGAPSVVRSSHLGPSSRGWLSALGRGWG